MSGIVILTLFAAFAAATYLLSCVAIAALNESHGANSTSADSSMSLGYSTPDGILHIWDVPAKPAFGGLGPIETVECHGRNCDLQSRIERLDCSGARNCTVVPDTVRLCPGYSIEFRHFEADAFQFRAVLHVAGFETDVLSCHWSVMDSKLAAVAAGLASGVGLGYGLAALERFAARRFIST